jgi:hypothetical protein
MQAITGQGWVTVDMTSRKELDGRYFKKLPKPLLSALVGCPGDQDITPHIKAVLTQFRFAQGAKLIAWWVAWPVARGATQAPNGAVPDIGPAMIFADLGAGGMFVCVGSIFDRGPAYARRPL